MTDHTSCLGAFFRLSPEDARCTTASPVREPAPRERNGPVRSHDGTLDDIPRFRPGKMTVTSQGALDIVVRARLSQADRYRILALPYPVEYQAFWRVLADMGVTKERLMDRMGASP